MSDSLREDVMKYVDKAKSKPKIVMIGEGRPHKSWIEIYTKNIEKETARKIFDELDDYIDDKGLMDIPPSHYRKIKQRYRVED